jgi:hypothetical protein
MLKILSIQGPAEQTQTKHLVNRPNQFPLAQNGEFEIGIEACFSTILIEEIVPNNVEEDKVLCWDNNHPMADR